MKTEVSGLGIKNRTGTGNLTPYATMILGLGDPQKNRLHGAGGTLTRWFRGFRYLRKLAYTRDERGLAFVFPFNMLVLTCPLVDLTVKETNKIKSMGITAKSLAIYSAL